MHCNRYHTHTHTQRSLIHTYTNTHTKDDMMDVKVSGHTSCVIDVWWLLDDGGLSLLVPHCLTISSFWKKLAGSNTPCPVRLFLVAGDDMGGGKGQVSDLVALQEMARIAKQGLINDPGVSSSSGGGGRSHNRGKKKQNEFVPTELWQRELQTLMQKFRLNMVGPIAVTSDRTNPNIDTLNTFCELTGLNRNDECIIRQDSTVNRWLRVSELLNNYSKHQQCVFITAPHPDSFKHPRIYMGILDMLSRKNQFATVLIRGNGENCLTFYSE